MVDLKIDAIPVVSAKAALIGLVTSTDLLLLVVDDEASARVLPFDFRLHEGELLVA